MKIEWSESIKVWWSMAWRASLYAGGAGFVFGMIAGLVASGTGHQDQAMTYATVGGYLAALLMPILAVKQALEKHLARLAEIAVHGAT